MKTSFSPAIRGITDINNDYSKWLQKDHLALAVLMTCAFRVWYHKEPSPYGLKYGEFTISEVETSLFGLKKSQHGQIRRTLANLIRLKYVLKTGRRIGNDGTAIYAWNGDRFMFPISKTGNEPTVEQGTNRERTGSNNRNNIDNIDNIGKISEEIDPMKGEDSSKEGSLKAPSCRKSTYSVPGVNPYDALTEKFNPGFLEEKNN